MEGLLFITILSIIFVGVVTRDIHTLGFFQQEEYDRLRFLKWIWQKKFFDKVATALLLTLFFTLSTFFPVSILATLLLAGFILYEKKQTKKKKRKLHFTQRLKRILGVTIFLQSVFFCGFSVGVFFLKQNPHLLFLAGAALFLTVPVFVVIADTILSPYEKKIQRYFLNEAKAHLKRVDPLVIGITGSWGKTSTKGIISHLLSLLCGPTFKTPKSYNTLMGVSKSLREELSLGCEFAVIEMGAYRKGSIAKLCDFVQPKIAVVTAVGNAHLERFGSQENIFLAKSELPQSLAPGGIFIGNGDDPFVRKMAESLKDVTSYFYGFDALQPLDLKIEHSCFSGQGTCGYFIYKEERYFIDLPLFGKCFFSNAAAAFLVAVSLGASPEMAARALGTLKQTPQRLEREERNGVVILNDGYNSNVEGFKNALEVLIHTKGKRKIVVTPGIIELGEEREEVHRKLGQAIVKSADLFVVVGPTNKKAFLEGVAKERGEEHKVRYFATRNDAFAFLKSEEKAGDVVLIENDLLDTYETPFFI